MKVSTRGRYGVNAAFELALRYGEGPVAIKVIAEAQQLSEPYLEQLLSRLRRAGLVASVRGALGGYELARPPARITLGQVLYAVEGPMAPADCLLAKRKGKCDREASCAGRVIWEKIYDSVRGVIDTITLADLLEEMRQKTETESTP